MLEFIARRILTMIPTLLVISVICFIVIQLPPGDFLTSMMQQMAMSGTEASEAQIAALRARYGLDKPIYVQYWKWFTNFLRGDMGYSFGWNQPVNKLIWERIGLTVIIAVASMIFTWIIAIPIGIYSAVRQYSILDYIFTFIGFLGMATPNFMMALILMYIGYVKFGVSVGGLFSPEFANAPWSVAKFVNMLSHLAIPMIVIGTAGTAGLIRILRANLLDELGKPYVTTARAKGVHKVRLLLKYPVRIAINPFISTIGWMLPGIFSGEVIVSVVLALPTTGPLLLQALLSQDMYLAGSFLFVLSILTVIGTLLSDILLALADPRIRYQ